MGGLESKKDYRNLEEVINKINLVLIGLLRVFSKNELDLER